MSDEAMFRERGFGLATGLGRSPALVIVDVQLGFTDPESPLGSELGPQIAQMNRMIAMCRERGWPVIATRIAYADDHAIANNLWAQKISGLRTLHAARYSTHLDPRLDLVDTDLTVTKEGASAFFGTDLADRLRELGADSVIVTGCSTSGCVRATVVDAIQHGFRPVVLADAVGDRSAVSHDQALTDIRHKYGDVESTDDLLARVKRGSAS